MNYFYHTNKTTLPLWGLLICLALLFSQGSILHVHNIDHGQDHLLKEFHSHSDGEEIDHQHLSKAHSILDQSHAGQYNSVVSEIHISADGLVKNNLYNIIISTLVALLFSLILSGSSERFIQHYRESKLIFYQYYVLSPPLRAPPLH